MRGSDERSDFLFSYVSPEQRVPADHPMRPIRRSPMEPSKRRPPPKTRTATRIRATLRRCRATRSTADGADTRAEGLRVSPGCACLRGSRRRARAIRVSIRSSSPYLE